jgi:hypothetical protein
MTWIWLFVWNASWFIFALAYVSLETKLGREPPPGGANGKLERCKVEPLLNRAVRSSRVHRR